ncbi:MAG: DUF4388 domain-containing protein, partial [Ktedonobacteraceae bacterium]|nr:DUF4388 domain-containing protein [Ktedonobacteraceae bacterium]
MSLIGSLELIKLSSILQRIEAHEKTGLLIIKQGRGTWVELYFRDGRLMCIGPLRTNATLADRLLYDGVISHQAYQEVVRIVGSGAQSEIPFAMALMDNGFATQEQLRQWASRKAIEVLQALLSWTSGEIHFEDQYAPQPDRLLVALSVSALLAGIPEAALPAQPSVSGSDAGWLLNRSQAPNSASSTPSSRPYVARIPTLTQPSQFFADAFPSITPVADVSTSATFAAGGDVSSSFPRPTPVQEVSPMPQQTSPANHRQAVPVQDVERVPTIPTRQGETSFASLRQASQTPNLQAIPVQNIEMQPTIPAPPQETDSSPAPDVPGMFSAASLLSDVSSLPFATEPEPSQPAPATAPAYVDISYMRPEMVLVPADLSAVRDARAMVQMTPDQWRLLTRVDGQTSLHAACQDLNMPPDMVCRLAGELIALHV